MPPSHLLQDFPWSASGGRNGHPGHSLGAVTGWLITLEASGIASKAKKNQTKQRQQKKTKKNPTTPPPPPQNKIWGRDLLPGQPNPTRSSKQGGSLPQDTPNPVWHSHCGCSHLREETKSDKMKAGTLPDEKATSSGARDTPLGSHSLSSLLTIQTALEGKQRRPVGELTGSFSGG